MGRKRQNGDPFDLAGTRLAYRRGKFWYRHRDGRWENAGTDLKAAKDRAALYNDPHGNYGTVAYWLDRFIVDCGHRVASQATGKLKLSARTLADYKHAVVPLKVFFGRMLPEHIKPHDVQAYLDQGAEQGRPVPANRERACLSSMLSWLLRIPGATTMLVNPCMQASGVQRNTETKRERYVSHEEYRAVFAAGSASVKLMMELVYRSLQRPEVDVIAWTPANVKAKGDGRVLRFIQSKTGRQIDIGLMGQFEALVREAIGAVPAIHQPLVHTLKGDGYTYDGISAMLKKAQAKVRTEHKATGGPLAEMPSFGFRDLKGKGATDMWLDGVPIEQIQLLCGHADKSTTEKYINARWRETATPNMVSVLA